MRRGDIFVPKYSFPCRTCHFPQNIINFMSIMITENDSMCFNKREIWCEIRL